MNKSISGVARSLSAMSMIVGLMLFGTSEGWAQQKASNVDGVKAASKGFYTALAVLDDGAAMGKIWAHTDYVTFVGPRSKSIIVGWDALKKYFEENNKRFSQRNVSLGEQRIHVNGNLAWEMGVETGDVKLKDGTPVKTDYIVTRVYEKIGGRWLIVSHHVQPKPQ